MGAIGSIKEPSKFRLFMDSLKRKINRLNPWRKKEKGALVKYAERELEIAGMIKSSSVETDDVFYAEYNNMIAEAVIELIQVFSDQGHSGFSASMVTSLFHKLARFKPITPLTGSDDEWRKTGPGCFQNRRCSRVFKEGDRAYDSKGKIFRDKNGATYTSRDSRVDIDFPYYPKSEVVDVKD